jgi:hypothetical protein
MVIIKRVVTMVAMGGIMMINMNMIVKVMETICSTKRSNGKEQIEAAIKMNNN